MGLIIIGSRCVDFISNILRHRESQGYEYNV